LSASAILENGGRPSWWLTCFRQLRNQNRRFKGVKLTGTKVICIIIRSISYHSRPHEFELNYCISIMAICVLFRLFACQSRTYEYKLCNLHTYGDVIVPPPCLFTHDLIWPVEGGANVDPYLLASYTGRKNPHFFCHILKSGMRVCVV